jgi:hypothetical protein
MEQPLAGGCCHANVTPDMPDDGIMWLTTDDVASSALDHHRVTSIAELFDHSPTAPGYTPTVGGIAVNIDQLARPEVFGVPASDWDSAFGRTMVWTAAAEAIVSGPRCSDQVLPLIEEIAAAQTSGTLTPARRAELLAAAHALLPLPENWAGIVNEAIALLEDITLSTYCTG